MARDKIHYIVCRALEKDGWNIIADPFDLHLPDVRVWVDLEAEKMIELSKENKKILVEIKSFPKLSLITDFCEAQGKYDFYRDSMKDLNLEHDIYLAISTVTLLRLAKHPTYLRRIRDRGMKVIVVDLNTETIVQWIE